MLKALAFASLMNEGHNVRISGQDVGRGTFSHRYVVGRKASNNLTEEIF